MDEERRIKNMNYAMQYKILKHKEKGVTERKKMKSSRSKLKISKV